MSEAFFMYVVECADGTLYTGYSTDVERRVAEHNAGRGAKYTRSRLPVDLRAFAEFSTQHEALSAEFRFKRLPRAEKMRLLSCAESRPFEQVLADRFPL